MMYLLDTNAWICLFNEPALLSLKSRSLLSTMSEVAVAAISLVEVCQKHASGKLEFSIPVANWLEKALPKHLIHLLPLTPSIAHEAYCLGPEFHRDPADRLIVATARIHNLTLVTSDKKLIQFKGVKTLSTRL